jgi:hypothetical protein
LRFQGGGDLGLPLVSAPARLLDPPTSLLPIGTIGGLGPSSKAGALSVRGEDGKLGVRGLLTRHSASWVGGRTGFGSDAAPGKDGDSLMLDCDQVKGGMDCAAVTECSQSLSGAEANNQVSKFKGGDPVLCCVSSGSDSSVGVLSMGGPEESVVAETVDGSGQGLGSLDLVGNSVKEASPTSKKVKKTVEVGSVVGLTCEGQEGLKVDCFRRIIVENQGSEEGNVDDVYQQEEESGAQERGNCSDYEA